MASGEEHAMLSRVLDSSRWFARLKICEREQVLSSASVRRISRGECLFSRGAFPEYWWGVAAGLLQMSSTTTNGQRIAFLGLPEGDWFGEGSILRGEPLRYDVMALRDSCLVRIPAADFHWLHERSISFTHYLIQQLNNRLSQFIASQAVQRGSSIERRVAQAIAALLHEKEYGTGLSLLDVSQEEIALLAGVSRQRCSQALRHLREIKLIETEYQRITVLDLHALRRYPET